jgi:hypothetical protein
MQTTLQQCSTAATHATLQQCNTAVVHATLQQCMLYAQSCCSVHEAQADFFVLEQAVMKASLAKAARPTRKPSGTAWTWTLERAES